MYQVSCTMQHSLNPDQILLVGFMSDLSERCYAAGWIANLEYVLWDAVKIGERKFGQDMITSQDIEQLSQLSKACNCWIYYDDEMEETAIGINDWERMFDEVISKDPGIIKRH